MAGNGKEQLGRKLLQIKETLEERKTKRSELQGEYNALIAQLKDYGVETIADAEKLIDKNEKELAKSEELLQVEIEELERMMKEGTDQ